jgi:hypothetical protein
MKILVIISILFISTPLLSVACFAAKHANHTNSNHSINLKEAANDPLSEMHLNNGNKWLMDEHTRSSFSQMAKLFLSADHQLMTVADLKNTGVTLQSHSNKLIKGCTMTGYAHDQLHEFLSGYLPAIEELSKSGNIQDAETVEYFLKHYNKYFK